ncbi:Tetraspanin family [Nesidiocoris tenuis]|uniref:Tetraspanin n=1 Tax=Nesidiocoris tenuis TaxID=355587 RepID=A0ABN7AQV4_9HEMI|nr:Tetraspanin family [Nesidiocoris tenuis]
MLPFYDINAKLRYIKYCLLLFTFLLVLTGISLVIIGSTINAIYGEFSYFLQIVYFTPATCLVAVGLLIFATSCLGIYGTINQKPCLIASFGAILGLLCVLQLGAGISGNLMTEDLMVNLKHTINSTMYSYPYDKDAGERMDRLQASLFCCGMDSPKDWHKVYGDSRIPISCQATWTDAERYFFSRGCFKVLARVVAETSKILTTCSCVLALMQLFGMAFAFYMAQCLRQQIRARKERKLLVTEQLLYSDNDVTKPV